MKKILLTILFIIFLTAVSIAQNSHTPPVKIKLKNSYLLPKKVTIISYQPGGDAGNGTEQVAMMPKSEKELTYKEGTKV